MINNTRDKKRKILFWGELPPNTVHGISLSNGRILEALFQYFTVFKVEDRSSFGSVFRTLFSSLVSYLLLVINSLRQVDIFYVNTPMSRLGMWKVMIAIRLVLLCSPKVKVVSHLHRGDFVDFISDSKNRLLFDRFSKRIHRIFVLSNRSALELTQSETIDISKVKVLHNTIEPSLTQGHIAFTGNSFSSKRIYYCLCNYIESKRIHTLVSVANQLSLPVNFNGTASDESYLDSLKDIDAGSFCSFQGVISGQDKEKKLNQAKALVLPSLNEGMPLVILESLAQGTPVICYNIGYISDYLGDDYPGLINEHTEEALIAKIQWFDSLSADEYQLLRERSFYLFWENFAPDKINALTLHLFNEL
ncbi:glycosyltransferase family 4 protein [Vibrio cyclitrophicus]|uniref:glycosyltransferase family 4 protein n=1 Tax=Vibrio cyclitrophicus TaxID=47951 RepID=UPI000516C5BE|nr:glycosyltransferase family 4 protein [Vibrio cyclitrophicus]OEE21944.1 glycosyl transferase group 1 [Vibrio cyclitrophicus ZF14]